MVFKAAQAHHMLTLQLREIETQARSDQDGTRVRCRSSGHLFDPFGLHSD